MHLIPRLDLTKGISIIPAAVRYHVNGKYIWGLSTLNGKDYATVAAHHLRIARHQALVVGRLFPVVEWQSPDKPTF